jgi:hypothetical protein
MTRRLLVLFVLLLAAPMGSLGAGGETFTPQSASGLNVTFTTEKGGGTRILVFGEVRNVTTTPAQRVVVLAEGLDENGRVVSRARASILGIISSRSSAPFEIRMNAAGSEKRYRVQVESFEFSTGGAGGAGGGGRQTESP